MTLPLSSGLTADGRRLVELAARLAREELAPRAARYDADATNPVESWRVLWREGLLAAAVPVAHGGLGLDMPTYLAVIGTLAGGCASTAMTLQMHSTVMRFIDALGTDAQKRRYFGEVVEHGKLFGSWGSEPAVSQSFAFLVETTIRGNDDGHVIDGVKYFCTMARGAAHAMVWCAVEGVSDMTEAVQLALVPIDTPGLATDDRWNTLGMRATYSPTVTLNDVHVPRDTVLGEPGAPLRAGVLEAFALGYAAIYLGIAQAGLDFAIDTARRRVVKPENVAIAHDPAVQRHVGELAARIHAAWLLVGDCGARWAAATPGERGVLSSTAKYLATEVALHVTSRAIEVIGGRGAFEAHPAARALRDVRTATLMSPTMDRMLETIGKHALGLGTEMFNVARNEARTRGGQR